MFELHIGDLAELYVLGELDSSERAAVDAHIASCPQCLRRVGEAEETLLAIERGTLAQPTPELLDRRMRFGAPRPRYATFALAAAAGLILGILTMLPGYFRPATPQAALVAMIHSHFNHAQFTAVALANAPAAKVIYAHDRSWLFIVADGSRRYAVFAINGTTATRLGDLQPQGATSTLYVAHAPTADTVELRDGSTVVERAALR
ncbi:MAG TPA: anti-sigma factor [Verrucomicrobiae bacterium]|nr:anti-sigma factor [Verrucomicrobiae bacterium]